MSDRPDPQHPEPPGTEEEHTRGQGADTNVATSVIAYLLAGPATFGLIGWLLDSWLGTSFLIVIGLLAGMAMSLYVIVLRYGTP
jgi:ATP synthase protein I